MMFFSVKCHIFYVNIKYIVDRFMLLRVVIVYNCIEIVIIYVLASHSVGLVCTFVVWRFGLSFY